MSVFATINKLFLRVFGLMLSVILIGAIPPSGKTTIEAETPEDLKLQVTVFSDVHMQSFEYSGYVELAKSLRDAAGSAKPQDALVLVGDNTMNGQNTEYFMLYGLLSQYNRAKNTLVAMGNHDLGLKDYTAEESIERHNFFLQSYTGISTDKTYYAKEINGYTFIILGGEGPILETYVSPEQRAFIAETLQTVEPGKPIFVFFHQQLYDKEIADMLKEHPNVFLFNGHLHSTLATWDEEGINRINLPGLHSHNDDDTGGEGLQIEVYDDQVIMRGRNYMQGEWIDGQRYVYDLA